MFPTALKKVLRRENLTRSEAAGAMGDIMDGNVPPSQIAAFLTALHILGEDVPSVVGFAEAMRSRVVRVRAPKGVVLDTCGTGGDGKGTFNISTISSFVVAAGGVVIAKHGNRAASSKCGSTDLLAALGVKIEQTVERQEELLRTIGYAYLHAPAHHPAMRHAVPVRRELGFRTVFNLLGPLCNPAFANTQTVGIFRGDLVRPYAEVLRMLGSRSVFVFHGADGLDELSTTGNNQVARLSNGRIRKTSLQPGSVGLKKAKVDDLSGGDPETNAAIARSILAGDKGPRRDAVLFNAGVGLVAAGKAKRPRDGVNMAADLIDSGQARRKMEEFIEASR